MAPSKKSTSGAQSSSKSTSARKSSSKATPAKKAPAKKAPAKTSAKKAPAKTSAKKASPKTTSAKKAPAKTSAKKAPAKTTSAKKAPAKKAPAKKPAQSSKSASRRSASPFSVGDKVVYPHHGAAVIVKKERREFNDSRTDFFVLDVATDQLTLRVPVENAAELGVRPVISKAAARKVFATFKEDPQEAGSNWSRWYKLLTEKINSGDIYQVAEVVRDLTYAQQTKGISPALKRMLSKARLILTSELRFALDITEDEATKRLDRALPKVEAVEGV
jgi:CarD family transcriptional regulator